MKNSVSTPEAVEIYGHYPRRIAKPLAIKAIMKAISNYGFNFIRSRTIEFTKLAQDQERRFIPYPATFYNQERFNDDYAEMFPEKLKTTGEILRLKREKTDQRDKLRARYRYEDAFGFHWTNDDKRKESKKLSEEIEELNKQL